MTVSKKIDRLIEEGIMNTLKNNKLATGLGVGALGAGAYGLNQYLGADDHYLDSSGDNTREQLAYDENKLNLEREYRRSLLHQADSVSRQQEELNTFNAQKIEPRDRFYTMAERYGKAAEADNNIQNPTSVDDLRLQEIHSDKFNVLPGQAYHEIAPIRNSFVDSLNDGTISDADRIKFEKLNTEMERQMDLTDTTNKKFKDLQTYRDTPEYKNHLEKEQHISQSQLNNAQRMFDDENSRYVDKIHQHNISSDEHQQNLNKSKNSLNKNIDFVQDKRDNIDSNYSKAVAGNNERMAEGKRYQEDDLKNATIFGAGSGALGIGATAAALANRNKKR